MDSNVIQFGYLKNNAFIETRRNNGQFVVSIFNSIDNCIYKSTLDDKDNAKSLFSKLVRA